MLYCQFNSKLNVIIITNREESEQVVNDGEKNHKGNWSNDDFYNFTASIRKQHWVANAEVSMRTNSHSDPNTESGFKALYLRLYIYDNKFIVIIF